jgi:hypothetical protein
LGPVGVFTLRILGVVSRLSPPAMDRPTEEPWVGQGHPQVRTRALGDSWAFGVPQKKAIKVIDSIFKLHRTTPPETEALEAPKPRYHSTLGGGPGTPWPMQAHYRRTTGEKCGNAGESTRGRGRQPAGWRQAHSWGSTRSESINQRPPQAI